MNKEKQIEEMAKYSCTTCEWAVDGEQCLFDRTPSECYLALTVANTIYTAGYRKQSEGEWVDEEDGFCRAEMLHYRCSICGNHDYLKRNFCSECGAKMKGADHEQKQTDL